MANPLKMLSNEAVLEVVNRARVWSGHTPLTHLGERDPRAVAKLSIDEQCEIKAFCLCGVPRHVIAAVFDVTNLTVTRINNATPTKYPRVLAEMMSFNTKNQFCAHFITEKNERAIIKLHPQFSRPLD